MDIENFKGEIKRNEPLSRHTSYGIGGPADILVYPVDRDDLSHLLQSIRANKQNFLILGGGTNLLVRDGGFRGVVITLQRMQTLMVERQYRSIGGSYVVVCAEAGVSLAKLLSFSVEQGLAGLEFVAGIPGTLGGAVCMNAGTSLREMSDIVESVTLITANGEMVTKNREEMGFGYRSSSAPEGNVVLEVRIALRREEKKKIKGKVKELQDKRKKHQLLGFSNAGSVFKNPLERSASKLIENVGLKGATVGGAQISDKHANVIVNTGKATAADVLALMDIIRGKVLEAHGVRLEPEIKIIGED